MDVKWQDDINEIRERMDTIIMRGKSWDRNWLLGVEIDMDILRKIATGCRIGGLISSFKEELMYQRVGRSFIKIFIG